MWIWSYDHFVLLCLLILCRWNWGRDKNVKVWELMDWDKESLLGKVKAVCTRKENEEFTTSYWQADVRQLLRKQSLSHVLVSWEKQMPSVWKFPFLLLSPSFHCWARHDLLWNIPLESAVLAVSPPTSLCIPSSSQAEQHEKLEHPREELLLCSNWKVGALSALFS